MRIKEILKEKGIGVAEFAEMLGISRQALSKQLQGKLLVETAQKIADALGVELWELFKAPEQAPPLHSLTCPHCGKAIKIEIKKGSE